jgi:cytochrome c oxidase subunit 3
MFLTIIGGLIFVGSQAWEWKNFIKGEYGAVETKGGSILQFVDSKGKRVALADFAVTLKEDREQLTRSKGKWFMEEAALPTYSVNEVLEGFKAQTKIF